MRFYLDRTMKSDDDPTFTPLRHLQNSVPQQHPNSSWTDELEAEKIRNRYGIQVEGVHVPPLIKTFEETRLSQKCLQYLRDVKHVTKPTPIQMQGIGCLIKGRDVIGVSSTGSGKSYAYILPLLIMVEDAWADLSCSNEVAPLGLVIVPSRELMAQIFGNIKELLNVLELGANLQALDSYGAHSNMLDGNFHDGGSMQQRLPIDSYRSRIGNNGSLQNRTSGYPPSHFHPDQSRNFDNSDSNNHSAQNDRHNCFHPYRNKMQGVNQYDNLDHNHQFNGSSASVRSSRCNDSVVVGVCGGGPIREDLNKLTFDTKVVVATPGRLLDLCERQKISFSHVKYFVIDECDKLLDMGLEEQLRKIVAFVMVHKTSPQVSLWSATLPDSLERLARSAVVDPIYIVFGVKDTVTSNIEQRVMFLHSYMKEDRLLDVLRRIPYPPVIVFVQSKETCDKVTQLLLEEQFHVAGIHADKPQDERNEVVKDFRNGEFDVLVATDLMSRGIDIPCVTHIINFDTPAKIEDYIHRCGRCGRLGREGVATTFLTLECRIAGELKDLLEETGNDVPRELMEVDNFGKKVMRTEMGDRIATS